jgi:DNA replication and repair protein RecF
MNIKNIYLKNFRKFNIYSEIFYDKNFIYGLNGSGKSSILESISLISNLKTFKNKTKNKDLININSKVAEITIDNGNNLKLKIDDNKKIYLNNNFCDTLLFLSKIRCTFFITDEIHIFNKGPSDKRKYFDQLIFSIDANYLNKLYSYNKILKNRNMALRNNNKEVLKIWNKMFDEYNTSINNIKDEYLNNINILFNSIYKKIFGIDINLKIIKILRKNNINLLDKEILEGKSLYGNHLDDYKITIDNKNFDSLLSNGEKKKILLNLKFTHNNIFFDKYNFFPTMLIDDLSSELDKSSIKHLIDYIINLDQQFFITNIDKIEIEKFNYYKL